MKRKVDLSRNLCELCGEESSVYCDVDSAHLCFACDRRVHDANFLVARHVRRLTCPNCLSLCSGSGSGPVTGSGSDPIRPLCSSCIPNSPPSSSCVSSDDEATSATRSERTVVSWSRRIGMERIAGVATHVIRTCGEGKMVSRAALAAAVWYAAKVWFGGGGRTCREVLRRLERCSGVPAKEIVAAECRMARAVRCRLAVGHVSHV